MDRLTMLQSVLGITLLLLLGQGVQAQDFQLQFNVVGPCVFENTSSEVYQFRSAENSSLTESCTVTFSTDVPRLFEISTSFERTQRRFFRGRGPLAISYSGMTRRLRDGQLMTVPVSSASLRFQARRFGRSADGITARRYRPFRPPFRPPFGNRPSNLESFAVNITVQDNGCQQIISVTEDGVLSNVNYTAGTFCQYWLQAAEGQQIALTFTEFSVGWSSFFGRCRSDFVSVDTSGGIDFSGTPRYCGTTVPGPFTSVGNQLNVLLVGGNGNFPGFSANYTLV